MVGKRVRLIDDDAQVVFGSIIVCLSKILHVTRYIISSKHSRVGDILPNLVKLYP